MSATVASSGASQARVPLPAASRNEANNRTRIFMALSIRPVRLGPSLRQPAEARQADSPPPSGIADGRRLQRRQLAVTPLREHGEPGQLLVRVAGMRHQLG